MTKKETKERYEPETISGGTYPWGTLLELDNPLVKKLGLSKVQAGETVHIIAVGSVSGVSERDDGKRRNVTIQLKKMRVDCEKDTKAKERKKIEKEVFGN